MTDAVSADDETRTGVALAAAGGALYAWSAAPGLTWLDAGELGAAAWELGVAHPPGFPVFAQVHAAVMRLLPLGDVAFRGNVASGLWAAVTLGLVYGAGRALGAGRLATAAGAALLALSPLWALHATTIEVYSGAAAIAAAMVWAAARARDDARWGLAAALLVGLAAGHHAELRIFSLLVVLAVLAARRDRRELGLSAGFVLLGGLALLQLPLRAAARPWRNWGDPASPAALWDHVSGARIRMAYADEFAVFDLDAVAQLGDQLATHAPVLVLLGLVGFALAVRRTWLLLLVWVADCVYATTLNPMGLRDLQNGVPGLVMLAIGAAVALDWSIRRGRLAGIGGAALAVGLTVAWSEPPGARRADRGLARLIDAGSDAAPPEALALVASDSFASGWAFAQVVEGARPDLAVVVRQHAWDASSVGPVRRRLPSALAGWRPGAVVNDLARLGEGGVVVWEWAGGAVSEGRPVGMGPRFPWFVRGAPDDGAFARRVSDEPTTSRGARRALGRLATDLGLYRLGQGRAADAVAAMELAVETDPLATARWTNLGVALSSAADAARRGGRPEEGRALLEAAVEQTRRGLALSPRDREGGVNLARYLVNLGHSEAAMEALGPLLERDPGDPEALGLRGVLRGNGGDLVGACEDFEAALRRDPNQSEAKYGRPHAGERPPKRPTTSP